MTMLSNKRNNNHEKDNEGQLNILYKHIFHLLPQVKTKLEFWQNEAKKCEDDILRDMALSSLKSKAFHCQGGAVFALSNQKSQDHLLELIIAYQTLCDYLDNLCDRTEYIDAQAFACLHQSLSDALNPEINMLPDYYELYPWKNDSGYISKLVKSCRDSICFLPNYELIKKHSLLLAHWYCQLQIKKHLRIEVRKHELITWVEEEFAGQNDFFWQELAAASGSTLALFALWGLAGRRELDMVTVESRMKSYFPWICGLHILLDYYVDQEEDKCEGDLNFISYYQSDTQLEERMQLFINRSLEQNAGNEFFVLDNLVVNGLLALYLSDPKVRKQRLNSQAKTFLNGGDRKTHYIYAICKTLRRLKMV